MIRIPGLIDPHVHMREPGATHKEDWGTGTTAALAGGFTMVLAMPNTKPPITDAESLALALRAARHKAHCDYAQFLGASPGNTNSATVLSQECAGLKMYLDQTYGPLHLIDMSQWMAHFANWPAHNPIAVHAEGPTLAAAILCSALYDRPIHICHVSRRDEILLIRTAKEKGFKVTCEVTPHHLFLSKDDLPALGPGRGEVSPRLATLEDRQSLWDNLEVIDCFASDHAPHTLTEKNSNNPPPGFPGLETSLPLLLTAVSEGRLSLEDLVTRCYTNPLRIFNLPDQAETWVEIDPDATWEIRSNQTFTRCGWTPFEGWQVRGKVRRVWLHGREAFCENHIIAQPGSGRDIRQIIDK